MSSAYIDCNKEKVTFYFEIVYYMSHTTITSQGNYRHG